MYLIQSKEPKRDPLLVTTKERDIIWLTYKDHPKKVADGLEMVTKLDSTWTTGRNALLEYVLINKVLAYKQPGYLYYIFVDDDMLNVFIGENKWIEFEKFLLDKMPSTGYISHASPFMHKHINNNNNYTYGMFTVDANLMAFHRYTIGTLIPYNPLHDVTSIFYSAYINNMLASALYSSSRIGLNTIGINYKFQHHRKSDQKYNRKSDFGTVTQYMDTLFKPSSVMFTSFDVINCGRNSWRKVKDFLGCDYTACHPFPVAVVTDAMLSEHFNQSHSHTEFLLNWRQTYKEALELVYQGSAPYVFDPPRDKCPKL